MHCDCERYGRRLCDVLPEELEACKASGQNCFSCGCLHYDFDDLNFEGADNWPPEEPDPWEGRTANTLEGDSTQPIAVEAAVDMMDVKERLLIICRVAGAFVEKLGEAITAYCTLMQAVTETAQKLAEELNKAFEEIGQAADWVELLKRLTENAWEDEDRETMRPEKKTAAPRPLLLRSCSLRVLYGQGFDPGPAARHRYEDSEGTTWKRNVYTLATATSSRSPTVASVSAGCPMTAQRIPVVAI